MINRNTPIGKFLLAFRKDIDVRLAVFFPSQTEKILRMMIKIAV